MGVCVIKMAEETWVKAHWSHSRSGERVWVPRHRMRENEKIHERHIEHMEREIKDLKSLEKRHPREREAYA